MMPRKWIRLAALALLALLPAAAKAAPALVADVATGRVLYAQQATDPWYPASVTKLMTAYVVLSAIRDGRASLETPIMVSSRAAAVIPSKMGFKPGVELTIDNALKMMLVKSANDMAVALAEGVGGSIENFADMMNASARRIGMRESYFVNPNGLPDPRNRTSARDLAILGRTILLEFPEYQQYFGIGAIQFGRRVMKNTNGLIGRYPGADGMKTGFICMSGFNVVATATRGSRRLIVVVLGAHSGAERTIKAATLFDRGFVDSGWGGPGSLETLPLSFSSTPPDMRDNICGGQRQRGEEEAEAANAPTPTGDNPLFALFSSKPDPAAWTVQGATSNSLGPRAQFVPIPVFVGRTPGESTAVAGGRGRKPKTATAFVDDAADTGEAKEAKKALQRATKPVGKSVLAAKDKQEASGKAAKGAKSAKAADDDEAKPGKGTHAKAKAGSKGAGKEAAAKDASAKDAPAKTSGKAKKPKDDE